MERSNLSPAYYHVKVCKTKNRPYKKSDYPESGSDVFARVIDGFKKTSFILTSFDDFHFFLQNVFLTLPL